MTADLIFLHKHKAHYQISQSGLSGLLLLATFAKLTGKP